MEQHQKNGDTKEHAITEDIFTKDKLDEVFLSPWACECGGLIKDAGGHCSTCQANGLEGHDDDESQFLSFKNKGRRFSTGYESQLDQFLRFLAKNAKYKEDRCEGRVVGMYKFHCEIGCGGFSKVKLATHIFTKEQVAIKIIDKNRFPGKLEKILGQEVRCMEVLSHPNLIRLYEVIESVDKIHLVTEWAPAGDLYGKVKANGKMSEPDAKAVFRQIVDAISYMHDNGIYHRDIKAENVLFSSATLCKVCDFGFSTVGRKDKLLSTFCGSPAYSAPELYQKIQYEGGPADVWSLGVVLYFINEGSLPFKGNSQSVLKKQILEGHFELSENSSDELSHLLKKILKQKPSERFTVDQIKNHPWLSVKDNEAAHVPTIPTFHKYNNFAIYDLQESILSNLGSAYEYHPEDKVEVTSNNSKPVNYRLIPTKEQIMFRLVSPQEIQAYEILFEIGVSEAKIRAHKSRGMRSYLIGIYRIILHKIQRGEHIDINKLGLQWGMSNSMMDLNCGGNMIENDDSKGNESPKETESPKESENLKENKDMKENEKQEEHQSSNGKAKCNDSAESDKKQVESVKPKNSEVESKVAQSNSPTSVSSQKKRILAKTGHVVTTKACAIL